ncbi:prolipoprotein diacylglyceryl transferase [soil metagenome]
MPFATLIASIPSPTFNTIELGPLTLRLYGLAIAVGVVVAVVIGSKRWQVRGGDPDDIAAIAIWGVPAGVVGARLYHVATDWRTYQGDWGSAFNITQGGLGIPGGLLLGALVGYVVARSRGLPARPLLDVAAPAIPIAQAIGRLGNWFNQEVFGRPTDLPWGLEIEAANRPPDYLDATTFHPTFLYEGLWNVALAVVLIRIDRTRRLRPAQLFCLYVSGYAVGRLWVEMLRADDASLVLGVRINIWVSIIVALLGVAAFMWLGRGPAPGRSAHRAPEPSEIDDPDATRGPEDDRGGRDDTGTDDPTDVSADVPSGPGPGADTSGRREP